MGHALRRAASQRIGGFDPLTVGWAHAYWAEGPEFAALGLSNGAAVATWPDEIGTLDLTQGTAGARPTYSVAGGANSKPTCTFDGGDRVTSAISLVQAQPFSMVLVCKTTSFGSLYGYGTDNVVGWYSYNGSSNWGAYAGVFGNVGALVDFNNHLQRQFYTGTSSVLATDESPLTRSVGTTGFNGKFNVGDLFSTGGNGWIGNIAFCGIFNGDVTGDAKWAQFKAYCLSHWGITVA